MLGTEVWFEASTTICIIEAIMSKNGVDRITDHADIMSALYQTNK